MKKISLIAGFLMFSVWPLFGVNVDQEQDQDGTATYQIVKNFTRSERAEKYAHSRFGSRNLYPAQMLNEADQAWKELDMDLLIAKLDRTFTAPGSVEFRKLMHPTSDKDELLIRQELVKALLDNQEKFEKICEELSVFAGRCENGFINVLESLNKIDPLEMARQNMILPLTSSTKINLLYQLGLNFFGLVETGGLDAVIAMQYYQQMRQAETWRKTTWIFFNLSCIAAALGYMLYYTGLNVKNVMSQIPQADAIVLNIGQGVALVHKLSDLLNQSVNLKDFELGQLFNNIFIKGSKQLQEIIHEILERERLEKAAETSYVSTAYKYWSMPDSLDLFYKIKAARDVFARMLHAVGVLDAYVSIARLYHEWEQQNIPVVFAEYEDEDRPHHEFINLYNPLLDSSIANDFILGGSHKAHHALLTGPHACGKTTSMHTLADGYILGQTITIVPAQKASFVPLTKLKTYFNIGDNLAEGLSSFTAEHGRLDELAQDANNLELQDRCLMLVDEPLAKTIQLIGEPRVTDFIRKLLPVGPLMLVVATHFEDPSRLEAETDGFIKNMQPEVCVLAGNQFKPTFKIIDGKADWWFHDKPKREAFVNWLLKANQ